MAAADYVSELPLPGQDVLIISKPSKFVENLASNFLKQHFLVNYDVEITSKYQHYRYYSAEKNSDVVVLNRSAFNPNHISLGSRFGADFFAKFHILIWIEEFQELPWVFETNKSFWRRPEAICRAIVMNNPILLPCTARGKVTQSSVPCKILLLAKQKQRIFRYHAFLVERRIFIGLVK